MRDDWTDGAAAETTVRDVRGYLGGAVRGRPAEGTLAREIDDHRRDAIVWAVIRTCLIVAGALLVIAAFIRPVEAQSIPTTATGFYLTQSDAQWTCAHEFGALPDGRKYWRPTCIRTPGLTPYWSPPLIWQHPSNCPQAQMGAQVLMWAPGAGAAEYSLTLDSYAPGALALTVTPLLGGQPGPQIISTQVINFLPQIPYGGCGIGNQHLDGKGR